MNVAIILAGGVGSRVGAGIPKQFIDIYGRPVIAYTLDVFQNLNDIDYIEIVCVESHINQLKKIVEDNNFSKVRWITTGGADFQHSVINGIKNIENVLAPDDVVVIHYAASPFVTDEIVKSAIDLCKIHGNAVSSEPVVQLCGTNNGDTSDEWVNRDQLVQINSPQCFKLSCIKSIYKQASELDLLDKVEPHTTSLMQKLGIPIYLSKGSSTNIKITTKEDVELFKAYALYKKFKNKPSVIKLLD